MKVPGGDSVECMTDDQPAAKAILHAADIDWRVTKTEKLYIPKSEFAKLEALGITIADAPSLPQRHVDRVPPPTHTGVRRTSLTHHDGTPLIYDGRPFDLDR